MCLPQDMIHFNVQGSLGEGGFEWLMRSDVILCQFYLSSQIIAAAASTTSKRRGQQLDQTEGVEVAGLA